MGKKNEGAKVPPKAPTTSKVENKGGVQVLDMTAFMNAASSNAQSEGLDPNHQVDLMRIMHETFRTDKDAAAKYGMEQSTVDKINRITAIGQLAIFGQEIVSAKSPFAIIMSASQLEAFKEVGSEVGIVINQKALPTPDEDGNITIQSTEVKVSKDAKEAIVEEIKNATKEVIKDPSKIENDEQLVETLKYFLSTITSGYEKFATVIPFYRSYKTIKAGEDQDAIKAIKEASDVEILTEITELVGKCPFTLNGMGNFMVTLTNTYKNPVPAFITFRNTAQNKETGVYAIEDSELAGYVRVLILWTAKTRLESVKAKKAEEEKNLKALRSDKESNVKAISAVSEKIANFDKEIKYYEEEILKYVAEPTSEFADNLVKNMKEKDKNAMRAFGFIVNSYMGRNEYKKYNPEDVYNNVTQYAGIATNLFRDPMQQLSSYSVANLVKPRLVEEPAEEKTEKSEEEKTEKSEEGGSKK